MGKYVFFIDTNHHLVGAQNILLNLAAYLADNSDNEIYFVNNYFDDDISRFPGSKLIYATIDLFDFSKFEDAVFFTPVNYALYLLTHLRNYPNIKLCHYVYEPQAINWLGSQIGSWGCLKQIKQLLSDTKACAYINYKCVYPQDKFSRYSDKIFIPISLCHEYENIDVVDSLIDKDVYNIAYYGAMNSTAVNILQNLYFNMGMMGLDKPVNMHIIGHVPSFPGFDFKECTSKSSRLIFTGFLDFENARSYMRENADLIVATGENAVESACFGLPVIVPVVCEKPYKGNNYVYLNDANGYVYTWNNEMLLTLNNTCNKIDRILFDVYEDGKKANMAKKCMEYCYENNSLESAAAKFEMLVANSELKVSDYLEIEEIVKVLDKFYVYNIENPGKKFSDFLKEKNN